MTTKKISAQLALDLGLCYGPEKAAQVAAAGGKEEYTVDEILLGKFIGYDDSMFMVCRTEVTPANVLREFATLVAREELEKVLAKTSAPPLVSAVAFLDTGNPDNNLETLAEHAEAIQRWMVGQLVIEGTGDWTQPEKIAAHQSLVNSCKAVRAATKPNPGEAAYSAANWVYRAATADSRDKVGKRQCGQLAKIFKSKAR